MRTFKQLPLQSAINAHNGTSFSPEKRGETYCQNYIQRIEKDYQDYKSRLEFADQQETFETWFDRYEQGCYRLNLAYLNSLGNTFSAMIVGPSNYPVRQQEKRRKWVDNKLKNIAEYCEKANKSFNKQFTTSSIIKSGDSDAIERLEAKIAGLEATQNRMKEANKIIKSKKIVDKVAALIESGFSEKIANELMKPDCFGGLGFASFELSNNNQNIRTAKARLESLKATKALPNKKIERDGLTIEDCPQDNRIRLFFSGKPNESIRSNLKSNGYRWTPSLGCWQAYRNRNAMSIAQKFVNDGGVQA